MDHIASAVTDFESGASGGGDYADGVLRVTDDAGAATQNGECSWDQGESKVEFAHFSSASLYVDESFARERARRS
jgi:hypothetical protein